MQRFDLKRFRLDRKLTQKELAEILMCKQNYISNIENGIKPISKEKLDILQSKFGDISKVLFGYITKAKYDIKRSHSRRFHVCWC